MPSARRVICRFPQALPPHSAPCVSGSYTWHAIGALCRRTLNKGGALQDRTGHECACIHSRKRGAWGSTKGGEGGGFILERNGARRHPAARQGPAAAGRASVQIIPRGLGKSAWANEVGDKMRRREEDAVGSWGLYMRASVWLTDWLPMVQCALSCLWYSVLCWGPGLKATRKAS